MDSPFLAILEKELVYYIGLTKSNPLRFHDDPYYMNAILKLVLRHPEWSTAQINDWFQERRRIQIKFNIRGFLARFYLLKMDGRVECARYSEEIYSQLIRLLSEDISQAKEAHNDLREIRMRTRRSWPAVTRMVMLTFAEKLQNSQSKDENRLGQDILKLCESSLFPLSNKFFNSAISRVVEARGFSVAETVSDRINGIIEEVSQYETSSEESDPENEFSDISMLQEENSDLRAALFGLKHELTDLQVRIRTQQETAQTQALVRFLSEMNAPSSGHLLDNIIFSANTISDLLSNSWQPESPEVEGIVYSLKMLTDFLIHLGITPIKEVGSYEQITMNDLSNLNYTGSEFQSPNQRKSVQFRSPGWGYKDQIISRPQAIEVVSEKGMKGECTNASRP